MFTHVQRDQLNKRLRLPASRYSVAGSLPVLFFGQLATARVATVALNPSDREYIDRSGNELEGPYRRFETLRSLNAASRAELTDAHCDRAIQTMGAYFDPDRPVYAWFNGLQRVATAFGASFRDGHAVHLDLVQEATKPTWSNLSRHDRPEFLRLREQDLCFLKFQLEAFPFEAVLCNGRTAFDVVCKLVGATPTAHGNLARVIWSAALAKTPHGEMRVGGWNIPLARPTGLGAKGEHQLGEILRG